MNHDYSIAFTSKIHRQAMGHLIRGDGQEDLCFGIWYPSKGQNRTTALLYRLLLPQTGERRVHCNASFLPAYFERALGEAVAVGGGLAFLHSHPGPGWQDMSDDDIRAEQRHAAASNSLEIGVGRSLVPEHKKATKGPSLPIIVRLFAALVTKLRRVADKQGSNLPPELPKSVSFGLFPSY